MGLKFNYLQLKSHENISSYIPVHNFVVVVTKLITMRLNLVSKQCVIFGMEYKLFNGFLNKFFSNKAHGKLNTWRLDRSFWKGFVILPN